VLVDLPDISDIAEYNDLPDHSLKAKLSDLPDPPLGTLTDE